MNEKHRVSNRFLTNEEVDRGEERERKKRSRSEGRENQRLAEGIDDDWAHIRCGPKRPGKGVIPPGVGYGWSDLVGRRNERIELAKEAHIPVKTPIEKAALLLFYSLPLSTKPVTNLIVELHDQRCRDIYETVVSSVDERLIASQSSSDSSLLTFRTIQVLSSFLFLFFFNK